MIRTVPFRWAFFQLAFLLLVGVSAFSKPIWRFSVLVAVERETAAYHESKYKKPIEELVREQLATITRNFNSSSHFDGVFEFSVDSIYVIQGSVRNDLFRPHPLFDYKVVIDGFGASTAGGGWYGSYQLIYHKWTYNYFDGTFAQYATDGLTHEFAHARGAIDIYGLKVDANKNPVNGTAFDAINSIMNYPYGNISWDEHTVNILNRTAGNTIPDESYITTAFPTKIGVQVRDTWGNLMKGVRVQTFPINWFSSTVSTKAMHDLVTNEAGEIHFPANPYNPGHTASPWHIQYGNFLLKASSPNGTAYQWMPFYDVQNAYFSKGADTPYYFRVSLPAAPGAIKLLHVNDTLFCTGQQISTLSTNIGTFGQANEYTLQLSDNTGNFTNFVALATTQAGDTATLSASIPKVDPGSYKIRVVSSQPYALSDEWGITLRSRPSGPLTTSIILCQGTPPPTLSAAGQNLRWYTASVGGGGTEAAPRVVTALPGDTTFFVSQTVTGCEGPRNPLSVVVRPWPTLVLRGDTTILLGEQTQLKLAFGGNGPFHYTLSGGLAGKATRDTTLVIRPTQTASFRVIQVSNACDHIYPAGADSVVIRVLQPLSLEDVPDFNISVYPIPAQQELTVDFNDRKPAEPANLELITIQGQLLLQMRIYQRLTQVPIHQIPAGSYLLRIRQGERQFIRRVVIY